MKREEASDLGPLFMSFLIGVTKRAEASSSLQRARRYTSAKTDEEKGRQMGGKVRVVVVGGGAAGLAAAISAARAGANVTIVEANARVGQKILKTGNGRCNLTNASIQLTDYYNGAAIMPLLEAYPTSRILGFFGELGLLVTEEEEGRIYPFSNTANTVLDVLRAACKWSNIDVRCGHEVTDIQATESGYRVMCTNNRNIDTQRVIIATGGGTSLLSCMGHTIDPFAPVLCPLKTDVKPLKGLSGVRAHARVSAYADEESLTPLATRYGEVLFRDYGLSGIVIFDMSREVGSGGVLSLDFLPQLSPGQCDAYFSAKYASLSQSVNELFGRAPNFTELMCGCFHTRVNDAVVRMAGFKPSEPVTMDMLPQLTTAAKNFRLSVMGIADASQAQVTRGGASPWEFNSITLESRLRPGIYAAGETLNVDGRCGGFNLHWAWASGMAAGLAAAQ